LGAFPGRSVKKSGTRDDFRDGCGRAVPRARANAAAEYTSLPTRSSNSTFAIMGLMLVTVCGLNHLSTASATADQLLPPPQALPVAPLPAVVATIVPKPVPGIGSLNSPITNTPLSQRQAIRILAQNDPAALARLAHQRCDRDVRDYTCLFLKQERIDGKLRDLEQIEVLFREQPKSVYMIWRKNADQAKRALFEDTPEFVDEKGEKVARVEPAGALIRLVVADILMPIHGKRARQSSRRSIDEFGFRSTLDLLEHYNQLGQDCGVLDLRYEGEGNIDGRPTYKIVRYLPYDGPGGIWPEAKMVMHIDQEWLLPTAIYSYADHAGTVLLGSYVHTQVKLNPGLSADAFDF
jgi:hypothetical protein